MRWFHLNVLQQMIPTNHLNGSGEIGGLKEICGTIAPCHGDISSLQGRPNLVLQLEDGRFLKVLVSGNSVRGSGYFYTA